MRRLAGSLTTARLTAASARCPHWSWRVWAPVVLQLDREYQRLTPRARELVRSDDRRIAIVGARGWIGRTTLALLREGLEPADFAARVLCFGSSDGEVNLGDGQPIPQRALSCLGEIGSAPTLLFHLAFLTKDKVGEMDEADYVAGNRALSDAVYAALQPAGVDRLFIASSGAAAFTDDPAAPHDLRLYGQLKRHDEQRFAAWARKMPERRRAAIGRIYNVSGPYINKHQAYALASFILDALAGRAIAVRAPRRVIRGYVPVRDVISFVLLSLLGKAAPEVMQFDTGGEPLELGDVAARVAALLGGEVHRHPITEPSENRYVGDDRAWRALLTQSGMEPLPLEQQIAETAAFLARVKDA